MSSRTKRSIPQVNTAAEYDFRVKKIAMLTQMVSAILGGFFKWGAFVVIAYFLYGTVVALSGQETSASFVFRAALDMKADKYLAYLFGGGGAIYGLNERRLRRKTTKRLTQRTATLEEKVNPTRTSSGLPPSGDTRIDDR